MKKVVYVDMKALDEEEAVGCWRPVGARTDRQHGLIRECGWRLVAGGSRHVQTTRLKSVAHERRERSEKKDMFIRMGASQPFDCEF